MASAHPAEADLSMDGLLLPLLTGSGIEPIRTKLT
jgi:hypothetical protein